MPAHHDASRMRLLLLGGTAEAAALADALAGDRRFAVILSLAGRTAAPAPRRVETRCGGVGGAAGLARYLACARIGALIDATHPFARRMSDNAALACARTGVPRIALGRPPWRPVEGDDWHPVADEAAAARALPAGARAFIALGRQRLAAFAGRADAWFLIRVVDPPAAPLIAAPHQIIAARGPFALDSERALLQRHRITHLVARNSGGAGAYAKLAAARDLALPVLMIDRPPPPPGPLAGDVTALLAWLDALTG